MLSAIGSQAARHVADGEMRGVTASAPEGDVTLLLSLLARFDQSAMFGVTAIVGGKVDLALSSSKRRG